MTQNVKVFLQWLTVLIISPTWFSNWTDSLPDGEGATEQLLQENATNNGKCLM